MEINQMLLSSLIDRLESQFKELETQVRCHPSEEAREMDAFLARKIRQADMLRSMMGSAQGNVSSLDVDLAVLRITFRQLKLELRFAQRKWKRILLNEGRMRRMQEKNPQVTPFAA